ncbi:MerR family transcriptional regulator [Thermosulfuriphilus sp.]
MVEFFYKIDIVAQKVGLSPQAIRAYVRQGLVPVCRREEEVLFSPEALKRLERIRLLKDFGVNMAGIEIILRLLERLESLQHFGPQWLEPPEKRSISIVEVED